MKVERRDLPHLFKRCRFEEKLETFSAAHECPPATERSVTGITYSNRKRDDAARSESVAPAMSRMADSIVNSTA